MPRCPVTIGMSVGRCIISGMSRYVIRGPLTYELALKDSPIRQFFDDRLNAGLKDAQAAYRAAAGPILIPGVSREAADAGTIGTAADWMMRFLVHPNPSLRLAAQGASLCEMMPALRELAVMLGFRDGGVEEFTGPARGNSVEPDLLYRACWGLALLTEVYRRGPDIAAAGPIGRLPGRVGAIADGGSAGCRTRAAGCAPGRDGVGAAAHPRFQAGTVGTRAGVRGIADHAR